MLVVASAYLISVVVADVFLGGATFAAVVAPLASVALLAIARAPLLVTGDWLSQRAADRLKRRLRADLTAHLLALGPIHAGVASGPASWPPSSPPGRRRWTHT